MRKEQYILFIIVLTFSTLSIKCKKAINYDAQIHEIDSLYKAHKLDSLFYPNMSKCGGAVFGYYLNKQLVLIHSVYNAELGYTSKRVYFNKNEIVKIIYEEHKVKWEKFHQNHHPQLDARDFNKMNYSNVMYTFTLKPSLKMIQFNSDTIQSEEINMDLLETLLECSKSMKKELETQQ